MSATSYHRPWARADNLTQGHAVTFVAIFIFAIGFPAAEELLELWDPISVITARIVLTVVLLVPLWLWVEGTVALRTAPIGRAVLIGALGFGSGTVLLIFSQWLSDPVTAALTVTALPIFAVLLEIAFDNRRLTRHFLGGMMLVLLGGYMATGAALEDARFGLGAALGAVGSAVFAWGSRAAVKDLPQMTALGQTTLTFVGTMIFCLACYAGFLAFGWKGLAVQPLDSWGWGMLLIYAWGAMAISQLLWIKGVSFLGVGLASFHLNAVPFYVMVVLFAIGGQWDWTRAVGAFILGAGVVLAQRADTHQPV